MSEWFLLLFGLCFLCLARTFIQDHMPWWSLTYSIASMMMLFGVVCGDFLLEIGAMRTFDVRKWDFSQQERLLFYGVVLLLLLGGIFKLLRSSKALAQFSGKPHV